MTAASPAATSPTESQKGNPKNFHNSNPTIKALLTIGKMHAIASHLLNIMPRHAIKVANVPNPTSTKPIVEAKLAIAQPMIKPIA